MSKTKLLMAATIAAAVTAGNAAHANQWVGEIRTFGFPHCPTDWLHANGQVLAKSHYPELFSEIGYRYGGSGAYFHLPHSPAVESQNGANEITCIAAAGRYMRPIKIQ